MTILATITEESWREETCHLGKKTVAASKGEFAVRLSSKKVKLQKKCGPEKGKCKSPVAVVLARHELINACACKKRSLPCNFNFIAASIAAIASP